MCGYKDFKRRLQNISTRTHVKNQSFINTATFNMDVFDSDDRLGLEWPSANKHFKQQFYYDLVAGIVFKMRAFYRH